MRFASWWRERPRLLDVLFAAGMAVLVAGTSVPAGKDQLGVRQLDAWGVALICVAAAGLVVRRRQPAVSFGVALVMTLTFVSYRYAFGPIFAFTAVSMYAVAAYRGTRYAIVVVVAGSLVHIGWLLQVDEDQDGPLLTVMASATWLAASAALGLAVRVSREAGIRLRAEERRRLAYEERLRFAREVHDIVGHSLAVISMNAGAALHVLSKQDAPVPQVERSLRVIRVASGGALDELRATLAGSASALLAQVPTLVAKTTVDGLTVAYTEIGTRPDVPAPVDIAGYRIVQEALANVVRHAGAGRAEVQVVYGPAQVTVSVIDDGRGRTIPNPAGTGLAGMRERAEALGGSFEAGRGDGEGFRVCAVLPWQP